MATYFVFFTRNSPLFLPKKHSYLTHLLKYESQFYNRTQVSNKLIHLIIGAKTIFFTIFTLSKKQLLCQIPTKDFKNGD